MLLYAAELTARVQADNEADALVDWGRRSVGGLGRQALDGQNGTLTVVRPRSCRTRCAGLLLLVGDDLDDVGRAYAGP